LRRTASVQSELTALIQYPANSRLWSLNLTSHLLDPVVIEQNCACTGDTDLDKNGFKESTYCQTVLELVA